MAHFARLDKNNVVLHVTPVNDETLIDENGNEDDSLGVKHLERTIGSGPWMRTYKDRSKRGNYASPGFLYYPAFDVFASAQPHISWLLDISCGVWRAPLPQPSLTEEEYLSGKQYLWDEDAYQADNTQGWVLETPE